jgi:hypothetical protein
VAEGRALKYLLDINVISELRKSSRIHPNMADWGQPDDRHRDGTQPCSDDKK